MKFLTYYINSIMKTDRAAGSELVRLNSTHLAKEMGIKLPSEKIKSSKKKKNN